MRAKRGDSLPENKQLHELRDKVQNIICKYEERLTLAGIKITVSKKYFEIDVHERATSHNAGIFSLIDYYIDKKRERKYKNERNKYHCIILSVLPMDPSLVRREHCKDYAFVLRKVERAHTGQKPQRRIYEENKLLRKVEKRILKIIKKAEDSGVEKTCRDTPLNAIRYFCSPKYAYKNKVLGKERSSWDLIFTFVIGILAIALLLAVWMISRLV